MKGQFLFISEDGTVGFTREVTEQDKSECDDGYMSIIRIDQTDTDQSYPLEYYKGEWSEIDDLDSEG